MSFIVAIDGFTGTGKGTLASALSKKYNLMNIDTGATYRCLTLEMLRKNIKLDEIDKIQEMLKNVKIEFDNEKTFLNGEDVSKEIRENDVNEQVSQVSHIPVVRNAMIDLQRKMAEGKDVILDGRDIGTVVFPNADVKIFLDASIEERAKRRYKQNIEKGIPTTIEEVRKNIEFRDQNDKTSTVSPVKQADDAVYINTTNLSIKKSIQVASKIVEKKKKILKIYEDAYVMTKETTMKKIKRVITKHFLSFLYYCAYRVKRVGIENLDQPEGFIICANHLNTLDAAGVTLLNKQKVRFVAKIELYTHPFINWLAHLFNIIPVKRDKNDINSIKMCLGALKHNEILGIFPEGTRNGMEKHEKAKNGAVYLASKTNVKIVPVGIQGNFKPFTKVVFNYGEPIDINKFKTDEPDWIDRATEEVMNRIIMLTNEKV